ncbi:hypothetical protein E4U53_004635, partial [Claviceps sorghi]
SHRLEPLDSGVDSIVDSRPPGVHVQPHRAVQMLASSPDHRLGSKGGPETIAKMAAAHTSKAKAASKASNRNARLKTQTHRRSRT